MTSHQELDGLLHHRLVKGMIDSQCCPSPTELSEGLKVPLSEVKSSLERLESNHGLVLHPHECTVWMIHPFAVSPSNTWIDKDHRGWWAPCMWCALGVAVLVGGKVTIHARIGGESEAVQIPVEDGYPKGLDIYAHFALPPRHVWDNVHHYCAMLLPFRAERQIDDWSIRHRLPRGKAVPIMQAAALARTWYGKHAEPNYQKWTPVEAQQIFSDVGLTGAFWKLDSDSDRF